MRNRVNINDYNSNRNKMDDDATRVVVPMMKFHSKQPLIRK